MEETINTVIIDMNTEDFTIMKEMLQEIEIKTAMMDPIEQKVFYKPIMNIIYNAWNDTNNLKYGKNIKRMYY